METQAETGGRHPPAQGRTPGAPRSWNRQGGPSPGNSAGSSALGHPDLRRLASRTGDAYVFLANSRAFLGGKGASSGAQYLCHQHEMAWDGNTI